LLHSENKQWEKKLSTLRDELQRETAALNIAVCELRMELRKALADTHKVVDLQSLRRVN
jgi:hypothetical protein